MFIIHVYEGKEAFLRNNSSCIMSLFEMQLLLKKGLNCDNINNEFLELSLAFFVVALDLAAV